MAEYIVGITGASGSIYGWRLVEQLSGAGHIVHLILTETGARVMEFELGRAVETMIDQCEHKGLITRYPISNFFAEVASGSYKTAGMIIAPCSMATMGEIATGSGKNLLARAADVTLKEGRSLIVVPRETPLSLIHLRNMTALTEAGAILLPASPAFYSHPQTLDDMVNFVVGKIMERLGLEHQLYQKWAGLP